MKGYCQLYGHDASEVRWFPVDENIPGKPTLICRKHYFTEAAKFIRVADRSLPAWEALSPYAPVTLLVSIPDEPTQQEYQVKGDTLDDALNRTLEHFSDKPHLTALDIAVNGKKAMRFPIKTYTLTLTAEATVTQTQRQRAFSPDQASSIALAMSGDHEWRYQGVVDGSEEVEDVY